MFSQFPTLLDYDMLVPILLRLTLVWYLTKHAWNLYLQNDLSITHGVLTEIFKEDLAFVVRTLVIIIRLVAAVLLLLGLFTQIAALVTIIVYILRLQTKTYRGDGASADVLLVIISLALMFLGPGVFSLDLPL